MSGIHTSLARSAYSYTHSPEPWRLEDESDEVSEETRRRPRFGWRFFHYLSGGGMRSLGRSVVQDERDRRQNRFLLVMGGLALCWLVLLLV